MNKLFLKIKLFRVKPDKVEPFEMMIEIMKLI